jgi:hypothetical protein
MKYPLSDTIDEDDIHQIQENLKTLDRIVGKAEDAKQYRHEIGIKRRMIIRNRRTDPFALEVIAGVIDVLSGINRGDVHNGVMGFHFPEMENAKG